jgi:DNA-binding transcriptional MerR regulator
MHDASKSLQPLRLFPEKLFYKIGEVSRIVGVESYVLRYWETEFPFLSPRKSKSGQRVYTKKDVDLILQVKKLLYEEKYTIDGVRRKLGGSIQSPTLDTIKAESEGIIEKGHQSKIDAEDIINRVKKRLRDILNSF